MEKMKKFEKFFNYLPSPMQPHGVQSDPSSQILLETIETKEGRGRTKKKMKKYIRKKE
jgi:hypothetical protein